MQESYPEHSSHTNNHKNNNPTHVISDIDVVSEKSQDNFLIRLKIDNAKDISDILSSIYLNPEKEKNKDSRCFVNCCFSDRGLLLNVDDYSKSFQASTLIKKEVFQDYRCLVSNTTVDFQIHLGHLLECLNLYCGSNNNSGNNSDVGRNSQIMMTYPGIDKSLLLQIIDVNGVLTNCSLKTRESPSISDISSSDSLTNFHFREFDIKVKLQIKTDTLKEILNEFSWLGESVVITIDKDNFLEFFSRNIAIGDLCCTLGKYSEAFLQFDCDDNVTFPYKLTHLMHCLKAISVGLSGEKASLQINSQGTLMFRNDIKTQGGLTAVEYLFLPEITQ